MEKQLKFVSMLSLQQMALRKVSVLLWSDSNILALFTQFDFFELFHSLVRTNVLGKDFEEKVKDKVLKLNLPKSLQEQMVNIVDPIGEEIRRWRKRIEAYFKDALGDRSPVLAKLCFTTAGAVDYKKSAEELVRSKKLTVDQRYAIACEYCLEDYIPLLWEELPSKKRRIYSSNGSFQKDLRFCWPRILEGKLSELDTLLHLPNGNLNSFNQWAFERSAENCNNTAAEYFFLKLTHEEKEASLMRTAHAVLEKPTVHYKFEKKRPSHVLCYLLCLMTPEQQMEAIKAHPVRVLSPFFDWPLQDLLVENANLIWPFVPRSSYYHLLNQLVEKCERLSFYFLKELKDFFIQSPLDFKKEFVPENSNAFLPAYHFFRLVFDSKDSELIEVMFRSLDAVDRMKIMCHYEFLLLFYRDIMNKKWHMVKVCLREANLSKVDREKLKWKFLGCKFIRSDNWENETFIRFLKFLGEADASAAIEQKGQKRKLENCSPE